MDVVFLKNGFKIDCKEYKDFILYKSVLSIGECRVYSPWMDQDLDNISPVRTTDEIPPEERSGTKRIMFTIKLINGEKIILGDVPSEDIVCKHIWKKCKWWIFTTYILTNKFREFIHNHDDPETKEKFTKMKDIHDKLIQYINNNQMETKKIESLT